MYLRMTTDAHVGGQSPSYFDKKPRRPTPKLVVVGSSTMDGRASTLLRIRPSLLKDVQAYVSGPMYLVIDIALQELVDRLKQESEARFVHAVDLDPSVYDRDLIAAANRAVTPQKKAAEARRRRIQRMEAASEVRQGSRDESGVSDGGGG